MRCSILGGQKGKTKASLSFPKIDEIFESDTWESAGVRREEEDQAEKFEREAGMVRGGIEVVSGTARFAFEGPAMQVPVAMMEGGRLGMGVVSGLLVR